MGPSQLMQVGLQSVASHILAYKGPIQSGPGIHLTPNILYARHCMIVSNGYGQQTGYLAVMWEHVGLWAMREELRYGCQTHEQLGLKATCRAWGRAAARAWARAWAWARARPAGLGAICGLGGRLQAGLYRWTCQA